VGYGYDSVEANVSSCGASTCAFAELAPTTFNGAADWYVGLAISTADLLTADIDPDRPVVLWLGTSSNGSTIAADIACYAGAGATL
jgi:hypothetical protein